jgi:uncharacterized protein YPO0396
MLNQTHNKSHEDNYSLFGTGSDKAGFRLQYMEVYNWGTFHNKIFRINPQGNNSLLTGANASGKSTFIDALLTLLVPLKKDRFYNQSSGVEKKGDRSEESYVYGHYGTIQEEGKMTSSTQMLRGRDDYSVLLTSFSNTDLKTITLFQVRWFGSNGTLNTTFGIAHVALNIEKDLSDFDGKGIWRKRLDKTYNLNSTKKKIEFFDGPTLYGERISNVFGMRSINGLSLFNQVVGVKVLEDLDEFIRTNMLEEYKEDNENSEEKFIKLKSSFETLIDAKTNIEKTKEQIYQLKPIDKIASELAAIQNELQKLTDSKGMAVYWFAKKSLELFEFELSKSKIQLFLLNEELKTLRDKEDSLKQEERSLSISIESDEVGGKIKELEKDIKQIERSRDSRKSKLDEYTKIAQKIEVSTNPNLDVFKESRETARIKKNEFQFKIENEIENQRKLKNEEDSLVVQSEEMVKTIQELQKNKNNISGREAQIREDIIEFVGATREEIPFIGELIRVIDDEKEWELSIEKILHNFALRLIVPDEYYSKVNEYVNKTNLKGRIIYQRYRGFTSLGNLTIKSISQNSLLNKIEFKSKNLYIPWLKDIISSQFNYACVNDLLELNRYDERAITKEGLIKFGRGKHEKDDRIHISRKENYVLGWDNKEKISNLKRDLISIQESQFSNRKGLTKNNELIKQFGALRDDCFSLFSNYTKYDDIDWQTYANEIQEKEVVKKALEATNNRVKALQEQLTKVQTDLKQLIEVHIKNKDKAIFQLEEVKIKEVITYLELNQKLLHSVGKQNTTEFENANPEILNASFSTVKELQAKFQDDTSNKITQLNAKQRSKEVEVRIKINAFKQPDEYITNKFKDWRSDVNRLPDSTNLDLIGEYQLFYRKLIEDDLIRFEKKFNDYLQETITNKVGDFRMFFENWSESIKENINHLNESLRGIDFKGSPVTYVQLVAPIKISNEVKDFRNLLHNAIPNFKELDAHIDGKKNHFNNNIEPLIRKLNNEKWRKEVMEVRSWYTYKAEEFYKETNQKFKTYENMGQLSGGEKAQLTYTILGSAIAYQFGLTKEGLQSNSFRFIAIDEAFKAQDEDKARYLISLCKQLHLQLLVVTPSDNIHIVEDAISFVHFVERKEEKYSWLYDMPIEQFKEERAKFINK